MNEHDEKRLIQPIQSVELDKDVLSELQIRVPKHTVNLSSLDISIATVNPLASVISWAGVLPQESETERKTRLEWVGEVEQHPRGTELSSALLKSVYEKPLSYSEGIRREPKQSNSASAPTTRTEETAMSLLNN